MTIAGDIATAVGLAGEAIAVGRDRHRPPGPLTAGRRQGTNMATVAIGVAALALLSVVVFLAIGPPD